MKRYIIEVPEDITSCRLCPVRAENPNFICTINQRSLRTFNYHTKKPDWCPLQETTMKSQAELERLAEIGRAVEFFADKTDEHGESYHVPYIEDGDTYVTAVCHSEIQGIVNAYRERSGL